MALKKTTKNMENLLNAIMTDLEKSERNKAAAQRVRCNSIKFEKMAKIYRKESMQVVKGQPKKGVKKAAKKKSTNSRKSVSKKSANAKRACSRTRRG